MKRSSAILALCAVLMMGAAAGFLRKWSKIQRIGKPGVRVVAEPTYFRDTNSIRTVAVSNSVYLPDEVLDFSAQDLPLDHLTWEMLPKDTVFGQKRYVAKDGFFVDNMVVLMGKDRSSIHRPEFCLKGQGFKVTKEENVVIPMARPMAYDLKVRKLTLQKEFRDGAGQMRQVEGLFVYWFVTDGELTSDHTRRFWFMSRNLLAKGILQRWAYVINFTVCPPGMTEAAFERLESFVQASVPEYQLYPVSPKGGIEVSRP